MCIILYIVNVIINRKVRCDSGSNDEEDGNYVWK